MSNKGLRVLCVIAVSLLAACARPEPTPEAVAPPPAAAVPPTPAAGPAATPTATPDTLFEESLEGNDLVKYQALPSEFQNALQQKAEETGVEKAVQHLRGLPDETVPIAELLDPSVLRFLPFNALNLFHRLDASRQRALLLGGYADAFQNEAEFFRQRAGGLGEGELDPKGHAVSFAQMVKLTSMDNTVKLPPVDESLSPEALAKLGTMDPLLQRAFRRTWDQYRAPPTLDLRKAQTEQMAGVGADLVRGLLAAPAELPSIEDLGLPQEQTELFKQLPADMREWLWEEIAADLVKGRDPKDSYIFAEQLRLLRTWSTPSAMETFARGYMPSVTGGITIPLACAGRPGPGSALLLPDDLPDRPVFLPPPEEVLSTEALTTLNAMDPQMRRAFNERWLGGGPVMPKHLGCEIASLQQDILAAPITALPPPEDFLPPELVELYRRLPAYLRENLERELATEVFRERSWGMGYPGGFASAKPGSFEDAGLSPFYGTLRTWVEWRIWSLAPTIRVPTGAQQEGTTEPHAEGAVEATRLGEDLAKYQTLPSEILAALGREIAQGPLPPESRPPGPGHVSIQDILDPDEQDLFDRLPVALKEVFWRVVARELVYDSNYIRIAGGKIIGDVRIASEAWVQFASQAPTSR